MRLPKHIFLKCVCISFFSLTVVHFVRADDWSNTTAGVILVNHLYTIQKSGSLYRTDLTTRKSVRIGSREFGQTKFLFAGAGNLLTIENDGSLFRVSVSDGSWSRIGNAGDWKNTLVGATIGDRLFTVEASGYLYETNTTSGFWKKIGNPDFANTRRLYGEANKLYSIEADGSLYSIDATTGVWRRVGRAGDWANTIAGALLKGKLYTIESNGTLYQTNVVTGAWKKIGKPKFATTRLFFSSPAVLYLIDKNGSLYNVNPSNGDWFKMV
jgi:hypothetical protein